MRVSMNQATLVLGSATPSVESFYKAERGEYGLLTLGRRAKKDSRLARVHVVDLREELAEGNRSMFSRKLKELMEAFTEETDHAVHEPPGLCGLRILPFLRGGHEVPPLRREPDVPSGRDPAVPLLRP